MREAVQAELDALDDDPGFHDAMTRLPLTLRVFKEAMRLYPPVILLPRRSLEAVEVGGQVLPPRTVVFVSAYGVHHNPEAWPEPGRFDPDRFLPEAAKGRPAGAYKPFGVGRRACTGRHFALVEAALCLALVLRAFDLDDPGPLRLAPTATLKPRDLRLAPRPR